MAEKSVEEEKMILIGKAPVRWLLLDDTDSNNNVCTLREYCDTKRIDVVDVDCMFICW